MTAFALKTQGTKDVTVSEEEIRKYYEDNTSTLFYAPEYRSAYYLRAKKSDLLLTNMLQGVTAEQFPGLVSQYNDVAKSRFGGWEDMTGKDSYAQQIGPVSAE